MAEKQSKGSYADRLREKQREKAAKSAANNTSDGREWLPIEGTHKIRVLPPLNLTQDTYNSNGELVGKKGEEDDFFYMTHAYHFFEGIGPEGKGKMLWTPKKFTLKDGRVVKDPIDEKVAQMYELARANKDDELKNIAGKIKRKRQFFTNVLRYTDDGPVYQILKDSSNEGKLMSQLCKNMGFAFYRDVQDEWVVESSLEVDEDREVYDLVDVEEGHDFKIKKVKTGSQNWDISYEDSVVVRKPRALEKEELKLLDERVDLRNYVTYCTYEEAEQALEEYLSTIGFNNYDDDDDYDDEPIKKKSSTPSKKRPVDDEDDEDDEDEEDEKLFKKTSKKISKKRPVDEDEDDDFDEDILDELDDDEK